MKKTLVAFSAVLCISSFLIQAGGAQDSKGGSVPSSFPIVPLILDFRLIPQFFRQPLTNNSKYASIDAFIDSSEKNPWYEIMLREKASNMQVYYCNSQKTVAILTDRGEQAYYVPIDFHSSQDAGPHPVFTFRFNDNSQQPIQWRFVVGSVDNGKKGPLGFMARPDDSGFVLLYRNQQLRAAGGTEVSIGDEQFPAGEDAFYAPDVLLAELPPTTEQWNVAAAPSQLRAGDKWVVRNKTGNECQLTIQRASGDQAVVDVKNSDSQDSAVQLDLRQSADQFKLDSMTVTARGHSFRISFNPALPLPTSMTNDKTEVAFTMDEDNNVAVASGQVVAARGLGDEHLQWQFSSPDWAKAKKMDTGVNVLFASDTKDLKKAPGTGREFKIQ